MFYEPVQDLKWHCYTAASWASEGDYSHQAVAIYLGINLVAWQSQRQSLVALSSAEAELIASVWGNRLALSLYGQLNEMILCKPPYITYVDHSAVVSQQNSHQTHVYESFMATTFNSTYECFHAVCSNSSPES